MSRTQWPFDRLGDHSKGEIEIVPGCERESFRNAYISIRTDDVIFPNGERREYFSIHAGSQDVGGAVILPIVRGQIVLFRNFRHALRRWEWEIPRGFVDQGETPTEAAAREMLEECGVATKVTSLGRMSADSGLLAFDVECFWCKLDEAPAAIGDHLKSEPTLKSAADLMQMIAKNEIRDSFVVFALTSALAQGVLSL